MADLPPATGAEHRAVEEVLSDVLDAIYTLLVDEDGHHEDRAEAAAFLVHAYEDHRAALASLAPRPSGLNEEWRQDFRQMVAMAYAYAEHADETDKYDADWFNSITRPIDHLTALPETPDVLRQIAADGCQFFMHGDCASNGLPTADRRRCYPCVAAAALPETPDGRPIHKACPSCQFMGKRECDC